MTETITVGTPAPELLARAEDALVLAQSYRIDSPEMREAAAQDLRQVKALAKEIDEQRKSITAPLDLAKKRVMDLFRKPSEFLERAEATIKRACFTWDAEQDRRVREAEAEAARKADEERKRLAAEAKKQKEAGNSETEYAIAEAARLVAPVPVAIERQKIAGESHREIWRAEVFDLVALCRAIADGSASPELVSPNSSTLDGMARSLKGSLSLPGVRAISERILSSRSN